MKKAIYTMAITILLCAAVFCFNNPVQAAGEATFTVEAEAKKTEGVGQTKEVKIFYWVKDFVNLEQFEHKGINAFTAVLDFDENVFEPIEITVNDSGVFTGIKTKDKKGELAIVGQNNWTSVTYNPTNKKFVTTNGQYINEDMSVIKITLKVKATAPIGKTTVTLKNIEAGNPQKDIYPRNKNVPTEFEVLPGTSEPTDPDHENGFGGYIRMFPDTTVSELKAIQPVFTTIKNSAGKTLSDTDYVPTGAITSDSNFSYTLIAVGDLNSDGKMTATDLSRIQILIVKLRHDMNDNERRAADIKWDANLTSTDVSQSMLLIVGFRDPRVDKWYGTGEPTCIPVEKK